MLLLVTNKLAFYACFSLAIYHSAVGKRPTLHVVARRHAFSWSVSERYLIKPMRGAPKSEPTTPSTMTHIATICARSPAARETGKQAGRETERQRSRTHAHTSQGCRIIFGT